MSVDFIDVVRAGCVKMKSKHLNNWNKRWLILKKTSSKGVKRLEKYHDEKQSQIQRTDCKKILLSSIRTIKRMPNDIKKFGISIELHDGSVRQFTCDSESAASEWYRDLKELFGKRDSVASSRSCENAIDELFNVYLLPSPNLNIYGECILQVSTEHIHLYDVDNTRKILVSWPVTALRRYGKDDTKFTLEAGRMCSSGEGIFSFNTPVAERIHSKVSKASNAIVAAHAIHRKQSAPDTKLPLERSQSESPVSSPVSLHSPVHESKSFPLPSFETYLRHLRPPAPLPRGSPDNTLPRPPNSSPGAQLNSGCEESPSDPPPPPPMRKASGATGNDVMPRRPPAPLVNGETNNNEDEYIYEEKYLAPGFRQYLSERKT